MSTEEILEILDKLMLNTIKNPKISTYEQIEGYLECIKDAKTAFMNLKGE